MRSSNIGPSEYGDTQRWDHALIVAILTLLVVPSTAAAQTRAVVDSIDQYVRAELARQRVPGMSVAVLRGDEAVRIRVLAAAEEARLSAPGR